MLHKIRRIDGFVIGDYLIIAKRGEIPGNEKFTTNPTRGCSIKAHSDKPEVAPKLTH